MPVVAEAMLGESGCKGGLRVREGPGKLARLAAEAGSSPVLRWMSPERWHEVEGEADGRDPPVSVCVRGGAVRGPRGELSRAGLGRTRGPSSWAAVAQCCFVFLFLLCSFCFIFEFV